MDNRLKLFLSIFFVFNNSVCGQEQIKLPDNYHLILEKLVYYKQDTFRAFYGGPISKANDELGWIMPVVFEGEDNKTRAVYEIIFVNCLPDTAQDAEVLFIDIPEINIKFKNNLTSDYVLFSSLLEGRYKSGKYIIVRFAEIANVYFPDIFVSALYGNRVDSDKDRIDSYLHENFKTKKGFIDYYKSSTVETIYHESDDQIIYDPFLVQIDFDKKPFLFYVSKVVKNQDSWKVYYLVYLADTTLELLSQSESPIFVRLDSGCVSGQIYNDDSCDCIDQLHDGLYHLMQDKAQPGLIIHIPTHDGRGFGTAPKAETEIYKEGGKGRVSSTIALDTVSAAQLLYGIDSNYDIRSFDGAAKIMVSLGIKKVVLLTDNVEKVALLQKYNIDVFRKKTDTNKASCIAHIEAKKNSKKYFTE